MRCGLRRVLSFYIQYDNLHINGLEIRPELPFALRNCPPSQAVYGRLSGAVIRLRVSGCFCHQAASAGYRSVGPDLSYKGLAWSTVREV